MTTDEVLDAGARALGDYLFRRDPEADELPLYVCREAVRRVLAATQAARTKIEITDDMVDRATEMLLDVGVIEQPILLDKSTVREMLEAALNRKPVSDAPWNKW